MDPGASTQRGLAHTVSILQTVIAAERLRIEAAEAVMADAEAELKRWVPLLNALKAYEVVGPMSGTEEVDAVWAPIHSAIAAYGKSRRGMGGLVADAERASAASGHAASCTADAVAAGGTDGNGTTGDCEARKVSAGCPPARRVQSAPAVVSSNVPTVVPTPDFDVATAAACGAISASTLVGAESAGDTGTATSFRATPSLPRCATARRDSDTLQELNELLASRCCHRIAASGLMPAVSERIVAAMGNESFGEQDVGEGGGSAPVEQGFENGDGADDACMVVSTARTFIKGVQTLDSLSSRRMTSLMTELEDPSHSFDALSVIAGVALATAAGDALDAWSIEKLKKQELDLID